MYWRMKRITARSGGVEISIVVQVHADKQDLSKDETTAMLGSITQGCIEAVAKGSYVRLFQHEVRVR